MKTKVKHFQAGGLYMVRSCSSANSLYFETKQDHLLFMQLVDRYIGSMAEVVHYSIIPTAWVLMVRLKERKEIVKAYSKLRDKSRRAKPSCTLTDPGRMFSEHIRFTVSQYVKKSNYNNYRHGSKIHSKIEKFVVHSEVDLAEEIDKMETLVAFNEQWIAQYHADYSYYDDHDMQSKDDVMKSAKRYYRKKSVPKKVLRCFLGLLNSMDVVRKLISTTWQLHFGQKPPPKPILDW